MQTRLPRRFSLLLFLLLPPSLILSAQSPAPVLTSAPAATAIIVLTRDQAAPLLPSSVFFHGRTASIQARNSAGLKLPAKDGDKLVLVATVDTSGYSSAVQESYQAYLLTEVPIEMGEKRLPPGAYGFGFLSNERFIVLDLGGNTLFTVPATHDAALARPNPMQLVPDPYTAGQFRLYSGRNFVAIYPVPPAH